MEFKYIYVRYKSHFEIFFAHKQTVVGYVQIS